MTYENVSTLVTEEYYKNGSSLTFKSKYSEYFAAGFGLIFSEKYNIRLKQLNY